MTDKYILDEFGRPKACADLIAWAQWFESNDRKLAQHNFNSGGMVSTTFLGIDHNFTGSHTTGPVLRETMVFNTGTSLDDKYQERYVSSADALIGHEKAVALVRLELTTMGD